jgi:hypothetical protein
LPSKARALQRRDHALLSFFIAVLIVALEDLPGMAREPHSEEIIAGAIKELEKQSDRGAGIIAAALIEEILETIILSRLRPLSSDKYRDLFHGNSPLASFAAKIDIAYAIGVINDLGRIQLHLIRKIRNEFAHRIKPLDFEHPDIKQLITSNELIANSGLLKQTTIRDGYLWSFRVTAISLMFWRDPRITLKLVHDEHPELAAAVSQYFDEHFTAEETKSIARTPSADPEEGPRTTPEPSS